MSAQHNPNSEASNEYVALPLRQHTILGVCEGIGEDFGFNPIFLRVPLAAGVLWSPTMAIGAYFALGLVVLVSRLVFPRPKAAAAPSASAVRSANDSADRGQISIAA